VEVFVRPATADDYDALCGLFGEVVSLHHEHLPQVFQEPAGPVREPEYFGALFADENAGLFVAEKDGSLIAFGYAAMRDRPPLAEFIPGRYAVVDGIGVKSEFRGGGIGSTLMHRMEEWAIAKGAIAIELNVYEFNQEAIAFYRRLGFETVSRKMGKPLGQGGAAGE
jgi:diamine N-acetyltransferase